MTNTATDLWQSYRRHVYHTDTIADRQELECSLAFYAGMIACFDTMIKLSSTMPDVPDEEQSAADLESLLQEIKAAAYSANLNRSDGKS